jgi:hypothetical protein
MWIIGCDAGHARTSGMPIRAGIETEKNGRWPEKAKSSPILPGFVPRRENGHRKDIDTPGITCSHIAYSFPRRPPTMVPGPITEQFA